jgi:hypothetical protein
MTRRQDRQDCTAGLVLSLLASVSLGALSIASCGWMVQQWPSALVAALPPLPFAVLFALHLKELRDLEHLNT